MYVLGNLLLDRNTPADEARGLGWIQQAARKGDSRHRIAATAWADE
jgi:hypothetical protein